MHQFGSTKRQQHNEAVKSACALVLRRKISFTINTFSFFFDQLCCDARRLENLLFFRANNSDCLYYALEYRFEYCHRYIWNWFVSFCTFCHLTVHQLVYGKRGKANVMSENCCCDTGSIRWLPSIRHKIGSVIAVEKFIWLSNYLSVCLQFHTKTMEFSGRK